MKEIDAHIGGEYGHFGFLKLPPNKWRKNYA